VKKVVVTGGAGFIGSHLAEALVGRGYQTVILDDLPSEKVEHIKELLKSDNIEFIQGSVTELWLLKRLFKDASFVFHLAAIPGMPQSVENHQAFHEVNVNGTLNVLLAAKENSVKRVIYASSSAVYGDIPTPPKREDMIPHPLSLYAAAKLAGEYYCQVFSRVYKLPTVCLRYFNVYGPGQNPNSQYGTVILRFIKRVSEGNAPIIFGDGEQTRDFTFVKDVVEANILAVENDANGIFNIASGESITINKLAELVIGIMGKNMEPIHQEPRHGDIIHSLADISKAKTFGYEPKYSLEAGLGEMIGQLSNR